MALVGYWETWSAKSNVAMHKALGHVKHRIRGFADTLVDVTRLILHRRAHLRSNTWRMPWKRWLAVAIALIGFAFIAMDEPSARHSFDEDTLARTIASNITDFGKSDWILFPLGLFLILSGFFSWRSMSRHALAVWTNRVQLAWYLFISVGVSGLIATLLKQTIDRARPTFYETHGIASFDSWTLDYHFASFPSGHATTATAFLMAIAVLVPRIRWLALLGILWVGASRTMISVHYPSDVIAGIMLGMWFSLFTAVCFAKLGILFRFDNNGTLLIKNGFSLTGTQTECAARKWIQSLDITSISGQCDKARTVKWL